MKWKVVEYETEREERPIEKKRSRLQNKDIYP